MGTPSLFDELAPAGAGRRITAGETAPYQPHSPTSRAAAEAIAGRVESSRRRVYDFLVKRGADGATDEEVADALNLNGNTVRPRRGELADRNLIRQKGTRRVRSGLQAAVWVATDIVPA